MWSESTDCRLMIVGEGRTDEPCPLSLRGGKSKMTELVLCPCFPVQTTECISNTFHNVVPPVVSISAARGPSSVGFSDTAYFTDLTSRLPSTMTFQNTISAVYIKMPHALLLKRNFDGSMTSLTSLEVVFPSAPALFTKTGENRSSCPDR